MPEPARKPNPAHISTLLGKTGLTRRVNGKTSGYEVKRVTHSKAINHATSLPVFYPFPVVTVTWKTHHTHSLLVESLNPETVDGLNAIPLAVAALQQAGYAVEKYTDSKGHPSLVIVPQEVLDARAEAADRAERAEEIAETLVPNSARVHVAATTYPSHSRYTVIAHRDKAVSEVAKNLRDPRTLILDDGAILPHLDYKPVHGASGLRVPLGDGTATVLIFTPLPDEDDKAPAVDTSPQQSASEPNTGSAVDPDAFAKLATRWNDAADKESAALPSRPVEGTALPAGHTLGIPAGLAADDNARDAAAALVAAGHTPALLSNETDEDDVDTARGTGFLLGVRPGGRVLVYHLVKGSDGGAVSDHKETLRAYRKTLRAAGWECDGRILRCVHAWRTSPLPEGVTAAQTRGEAPPADDGRDNDIREAAAVLIAAGHVPAPPVSSDEDDDDSDATGFRIEVRPSWIVVQHLSRGRTGSSNASPLRAGTSVARHKQTLRAYQSALWVAGWQCLASVAHGVYARRATSGSADESVTPTP